MTAVPDCWPARKTTVALPASVRASAGSTEPNEAVKVTTVPFWTGVPADSVTDAMTVAVPFTGTVVVLTLRVMVDSVGASKGTLSQPAPSAIERSTPMAARLGRDTWETRKHNRRMGLA